MTINRGPAVLLHDVGLLGKPGHDVVIIQRQPVLQRLPGDGPVHGAGIDVLVSKALGHRARERALARARRPIDGNHH